MEKEVWTAVLGSIAFMFGYIIYYNYKAFFLVSFLFAIIFAAAVCYGWSVAQRMWKLMIARRRVSKRILEKTSEERVYEGH